MLDGSALAYRYDGSFAGFLCCVYESLSKKERPADILTEESPLTLYPVRDIPTDPDIAARMRDSIPRRMGVEARREIGCAFLHADPGRELAILDFMEMGYRMGPCVTALHGDPVCRRLLAMAKEVSHEAHMWCGFARFSEIGGALVGVIEPKHRVLALTRTYFAGRYREERFLLYDKTHGEALVYRPYETRLVELEHFEPEAPDAVERAYRRLWAGYYRAAAVEGRISPARQRQHMPKRMWGCLTELQPENLAPYEETGLRVQGAGGGEPDRGKGAGEPGR